ncbi:cytochrome P450 [Phellopilus nigrolimitatus]|nr:cytochrome P450 [Phellopilus nigrolimitatus]
MSTVALFTALFAALLCKILWTRSTSSSPLPPGPKGSLFFGNLQEISSKYQWRTFSAWRKTFGDIIYMNVLGRPIVVLNKFEHAHELMDKQGAIYSDRPRMVFLGEMVKLRSVTFIPYGDLWRRHRRLIQQYFNPRSVVSLRPHQVRSVHDLLEDLLQKPEDFYVKTKRYAASSILSATYGHQVALEDDPVMKLNTHSESVIVRPGAPGATLVDLFPALRFMPSFLPGGRLKRIAAEGKDALRNMIDKPFDMVKERRADGTAAFSLVSLMLDDYEQKGVVDELQYRTIKEVSGSLYRAGVGTSYTVLRIFILAMVLHPHVAKKAQEEIDRVIGSDRLPSFEDRDKDALPYIDCILKECLRWRPPFPLGIAHRAMKDGELEGKFIPKGSLIMPNIWQMMHDERNYTDPEAFLPERFMVTHEAASKAVLDPASAVFGFGRRICPGRHFAEASAWLAIASILAVFNLGPVLDDNGNKIQPDVIFTSGLHSAPEQFDCKIIPRSEKSVLLIKKAVSAY